MATKANITSSNSGVLELSSVESSEGILVADSKLLFTGEYSRDGSNLQITLGEKSLIVRDYFDQETPPNLATVSVSAISNIQGTVNADNNLTGDAFSDAIFGLAGNDILDGAGGNDFLTGGPGADQLTGGSGLDEFIMLNSNDGTMDTIIDFNITDDTINLVDFLDNSSLIDATAAIEIQGDGTDSVLTVDGVVVATLNNITGGDIVNVIFDPDEAAIAVAVAFVVVA